MALRSQAAIAYAVVMLVLPAAGEDSLAFKVRHQHLIGGCSGTLTLSGDGMQFESGEHRLSLAYNAVQELRLEPKTLRVVTYEDRKWLLGADREITFTGEGFETARALLEPRLDGRLRALVAAPVETPVWETGAKLMRRFGGVNGRLLVGRARVVFEAPGSQARTWKLADIETVGTSGPFDLTLNTYENGGRSYRFQLKERLTEDRYNELWKSVYEEKR